MSEQKIRKLEVQIEGKVIGFFDENAETKEEAAARILLEGELRGNSGKSRLHLSIKNRLNNFQVIDLG